MTKRRNHFNDKRARLVRSRLKRTYAEIFLRVIKAGFGKEIRAVVYPPRGGLQMFVFYLEGRENSPPITRATRYTPFFAAEFRIGAMNVKNAVEPIAYYRAGVPNLPIVIIVRRLSETGKKQAFRDADKVYADIALSVHRQ